jgi:kynurenine formamidase
MKSFVDVSHTIENGLVTYPGLPAPVICDFLSREASRQHYAEGTEFQIGKIEMVANTGTYIDSPFHRYADGRDLSDLPLPSLADLDGVVVRAVDREQRGIDYHAFSGLDLKGKAVLVNTGWDKHWNTGAYFSGHPFLTRNAAEYLVQGRPALVGIDSLNIDDTDDPARPVHTILLGNDIPVVEHLCRLGQLPRRGFKFFAVPVKVREFGTFPVRAFGILEN